MATTYDEEVLKRAEKMAQARKAAPVQTAAAPQTNRFLKPAYPVAAGGLAAFSQAVSEKESLDRVSNDPNATVLDKGAAFGGATARTMGAGAGAIYGGAKGAALGSMAGPIGTAVGGVVGAGLGGYLGSKAADMAIEGGKDAVATQIGIPRNKPSDLAQAEQAQQATPYRNESLTATSSRNIPAPQQQPVGQQSMQPTAPQQAPNTVNGRDVGLTAPDNGFRAYPAESGFNFDKFQPQSGEGAFRNEQTGQVTRLSSPGAVQPVQQARGMRVIMDEPQQLQQVQPARQPVVMPQLNTGGGVFASMANFANQASQAYAQGVQNKSIRKDAERDNARQEALRSSQIAAGRLGLDSFRAQTDAQQGAARMQDEASTNDLRRKAVQADLDTKAQLDAARQEYLAAGDDPAKQKAAAKKLAVLSGKDGKSDNLKDNFIVVGGGQEYDQASGTMRNVPQTLVDLRTGQPVALPAQQAQAKTAATGQKYTVGQTVVKPDGSRGRVVAIDANGMATEIQPL